MDAKPVRARDSVELLSPALLDRERSVVEETAALASDLRLSLGWHYLLDVAWTLRNLPVVPNMVVLDAGAGIGITQWLLAERGVNVVSVDREDRSAMSLRFRTRYRVRGANRADLRSTAISAAADIKNGAAALDLIRNSRAVLRRALGKPRPDGAITLHTSALAAIPILPDASVGGIVSISSLEHNDLGTIPAIVAELWRVLRPGGVLTATVGAAKDADWFHEPSRGWCLTEETLRKVFGIDPDVVSNYDQFDEILEATRSNSELRRRLARTYFRGPNNGMPWGRWDPTYLSVGIRRVKPA